MSRKNKKRSQEFKKKRLIKEETLEETQVGDLTIKKYEMEELELPVALEIKEEIKITPEVKSGYFCVIC